ncbi:MAG TPA: hypothetical protein VHW47_06640 [Acidimicrobiales bacterium]|jgi:hypothetical protein|nr:hypothetical protein [Acidimicrobiales bacterium]
MTDLGDRREAIVRAHLEVLEHLYAAFPDFSVETGRCTMPTMPS